MYGNGIFTVPTNLPYYHTKISPIDPMGLFFMNFAGPNVFLFPKITCQVTSSIWGRGGFLF